MLPAVLVLLAAAAPSPSLRVVVLPFVPVGTSPEEAKAVERVVRGEVGQIRDATLVPPEAVASRVAASAPTGVADCHDETCAARVAQVLDVDGVVTGVVTGLGGAYSVLLTFTGRTGAAARHASAEIPGPPVDPSAAVRRAVGNLLGLATPSSPGPAIEIGGGTVVSSRWRRVPAITALGAAGTFGIAGGVLGGLSSATAARVDAGATGCPGSGSAYLSCFAGQIRTGRAEATAANALFIAAGAAAIAAVVMFAWPESRPAPPP